jgi:hypothetical protein
MPRTTACPEALSAAVGIAAARDDGTVGNVDPETSASATLSALSGYTGALGGIDCRLSDCDGLDIRFAPR